MLGPPRSLSSPGLSHLRSPSPPLDVSYARASGVGGGPGTHGSYAAFVLDPAMAHSFRTHLLAELQATAENLAQGETTLTRALGRLWKVLSEEEHSADVDESVPKREDGDEEDVEMDERSRRLARAPDVAPVVHKLFLNPFPNGASLIEQSQFGSPQIEIATNDLPFHADTFPGPKGVKKVIKGSRRHSTHLGTPLHPMPGQLDSLSASLQVCDLAWLPADVSDALYPVALSRR